MNVHNNLNYTRSHKEKKYLLAIILLIVFHISANIIWQFLDNTPPDWDNSGHIIQTINYAKYLLEKGPNMQLKEFLSLSNYYPIFTYLTGIPLALLGKFSYKLIQLTGTLFLSLSLIFLYLFVKIKTKNNRLAFLTSFLFSFFITVAKSSRDQMLDLPLTAIIILSLYLLEKFKGTGKNKYLYAFFATWGLAQNTKWYAFIYLAIPLIFAFFYFLSHKFFTKKNCLYFFSGFSLFLVLTLPWYLVNYQRILDYGSFAWKGEKNLLTNLFSLESLFFHLKYIIIFEISFVGFLLLVFSLFLIIKNKEKYGRELIFIFLFNYLFFTFVPNKNIRYIIPLMPFAAMIMAYGINKIFESKYLILKLLSWIIVFYYPLAYFILFFGLPFYPKYKYVIKFPLIGYVDIYYLADYPVRYIYNKNVWPQEKIVKDLVSFSLKPVTIFVAADRLTFNASNLTLFSLIGQKNLFFSCNYPEFSNLKSEEELKSYLDQFDYVLVPKTRVIGEDINFVSFKPLKMVQAYFLEGKAVNFSLIKQYYLPASQSLINDEDTLLLYQKTL